MLPETNSDVDNIVDRVGITSLHWLHENKYAVCSMCLTCGIFDEHANEVDCENCDCNTCKEVLDLAAFAYEVVTLVGQNYSFAIREE